MLKKEKKEGRGKEKNISTMIFPVMTKVKEDNVDRSMIFRHCGEHGIKYSGITR